MILLCIAVKEPDSSSMLFCCCTKNHPINKAPTVKIIRNTKAGEALEVNGILFLDCGTDESNKIDVSSCCGFFDLRLAMAAGDGRDLLEEVSAFSGPNSTK